MTFVSILFSPSPPFSFIDNREGVIRHLPFDPEIQTMTFEYLFWISFFSFPLFLFKLQETSNFLTHQYTEDDLWVSFFDFLFSFFSLFLFTFQRRRCKETSLDSGIQRQPLGYSLPYSLLFPFSYLYSRERIEF